jgi:hypothetical protein
MHCFELQSWLTMRMTERADSSVNQSEPSWLDLSAYRDVTLWVEIEGVTIGATSLTLNLQTNASKEEDLFQTMASIAITSSTLSASLGVTVLPVHIDVASTPLARWLRWQLVTTGSFSTEPAITFRIWAAAGGAGSGMGAGMGAG